MNVDFINNVFIKLLLDNLNETGREGKGISSLYVGHFDFVTILSRMKLLCSIYETTVGSVYNNLGTTIKERISIITSLITTFE